MTDLSHIDVGTILPQQPPFRFVDTLESWDGKTTVTGLSVSTDILLIEKGLLSEAGLLEHIAQSCAARIGYETVYIRHEPMRIGFIGQVKDYKIARLPRVGERLRTTVELVSDVFGISLCDVSVRSGEQFIAKASIKTALKSD